MIFALPPSIVADGAAPKDSLLSTAVRLLGDFSSLAWQHAPGPIIFIRLKSERMRRNPAIDHFLSSTTDVFPLRFASGFLRFSIDLLSIPRQIKLSAPRGAGTCSSGGFD